ncbi:transcriptional repressor p66-beta simjang isoform X3 [Rhodnius prolixus]|uniref:transcriptional repressor p66-beta simjang isoform X3 n=1 Tax=Rhodnius prolixus TaxID=13249 RepID=UPI003D188A98
MEAMEIDEEVVDLSLRNNRRVPEIPRRSPVCWPAPRRCLRPRTELRSYVETPDVVPVVVEEARTNGYANGFNDVDDVDLPMPPLPVIKELTEMEVAKREETVRRLRTELRNEEMTLVLLKKLRQSYQMKENVAIVNPCSTVPSNAVPPGGMNNAGIVGNTVPQIPTPGIPVRQAPPRSSSKPPPPQPSVHHLLRTVSFINNTKLQPTMNSRGAPNIHVPPPVLPNRGITQGMPQSVTTNLHQPASTMSRSSANVTSARSLGLNFAGDRKDARHSPAPTQQDRRLDEGQTPAQRQAAAKLALRKQLEKTLLQIPPPKPPPPEMHFIPNPSNTEFIYLVGLEHVVDYITKDSRSPPPPEPFRCSQCTTDFTPVWKWEKSSIKGKEPKVICEQCVTSNVKKALKAEHTNRLKTAFVKALQQEQEIEQRLAQGSPGPDGVVVMPVGGSVPGSSAASVHASSTATVPQSAAGSVAVAGASSGMPTANTSGICSTTPNSIMSQSGNSLVGSSSGVSVAAQGAPPPQPPPAAPQPPPAVLGKPATPKPTPQPQTSSNRDHLAKLADSAKFNPHHAAAAIHQQLLRGLPPHQPLPAHMLPFTPLLYPYQLAMANAAVGAGNKSGPVSIVELQRQAADLQRQYLLDMIPPPNPTRHSVNNWKT